MKVTISSFNKQTLIFAAAVCCMGLAATSCSKDNDTPIPAKVEKLKTITEYNQLDDVLDISRYVADYDSQDKLQKVTTTFSDDKSKYVFDLEAAKFTAYAQDGTKYTSDILFNADGYITRLDLIYILYEFSYDEQGCLASFTSTLNDIFVAITTFQYENGTLASYRIKVGDSNEQVFPVTYTSIPDKNHMAFKVAVDNVFLFFCNAGRLGNPMCKWIIDGNDRFPTTYNFDSENNITNMVEKYSAASGYFIDFTYLK